MITSVWNEAHAKSYEKLMKLISCHLTTVSSFFSSFYVRPTICKCIQPPSNSTVYTYTTRHTTHQSNTYVPCTVGISTLVALASFSGTSSVIPKLSVSIRIELQSFRGAWDVGHAGEANLSLESRNMELAAVRPRAVMDSL